MNKLKCLLPAVLLGLSPLPALDWEATGELAGALHVNDLAIGPGGHLYAAANTAAAGLVFRSTDLTTWQLSGTLPGAVAGARALAVTAAGDLLLGTNGDYGEHSDAPLIHRTEDGEDWSFLSRVTGTRVGTAVHALLVDDAGRLHAGHNVPLGMSGAGPCVSTDGGTTWTQPAVPANPDGMGPFSHYCLLRAADNSVYLGAWNAGGRMLKSTDRGGSWQHTGAMYDAGHVYAAVAAPDGTLFAGTAPKNVPAEPIGRVFKSTTGGATWDQVGYGSFGTTKWVRSLCRVSDGALYAGTAPRTVGNDAEVFVSTDGGTTWAGAGTLPGSADIYRLLEVEDSGRSWLYAATGPGGDVFRAELGPVGTRESPEARNPEAGWTVPAILRGSLVLPSALGVPTPGFALLDASGRKVMSLRPGPNDVRRLAPGVYFVHSSVGSRCPQPPDKVVIQR
jgi:hypothetical protein